MLRGRLVKGLRRAAPFLGSAAILLLLFRRIPPERLAEAFSGADPVRFLAALLPVSALYVALDGALLRAVLSWFHPPGLTLREAVSMRAVDYLVSLWNGRASQAALALALGRRFGAGGAPPDSGYWECAGTVLFLDVSQRLHLLLWAALGALSAGGGSPGRVPAAAAVGVAALALLAAFLRGRLRMGSARLGPPRWRILHSFRSAAPRHYLAALAWKGPLLLAAAVGHHFALGAFGITVPVGSLLVTLPIIFLAGAMPIAIARVGTSQAAWLWLHGSAAAASPGGEAALLAYSLAAHLTFLLANAAISAPFLPAAFRSVRGAAPGSRLRAA